MNKRFACCIVLLLCFILLTPMLALGNADAEERAYYILSVSHNGAEENDETDGTEGKLTVKVYLNQMPGLIAGGSFGLDYPDEWTGFAFESKYPTYDPYDTETMADSYHFFHFMESEEQGTARQGINAMGNKRTLLCTYTFDMTYADFEATAAETWETLLTELQYTTIPGTEDFDEPIIAPAWQEDEEGDYCYQGVLFDETLDSTFPIYFKWEVASTTGVDVSGKVLSYDPKKTTEIQLVSVDDSSVVYGTSIDAETEGKGQVEQAFTVENVPPGDYTLIITKASHLSFTKETVTVGTDPLTLTGLTTGAEDDTSETANLLCGDIDQDGYIKFSDRNALFAGKYYGKAVSDFTEENELTEAALRDLDGDGYIKMSDLNIMMAAHHYGKSNVIISVGETEEEV